MRTRTVLALLLVGFASMANSQIDVGRPVKKETKPYRVITFNILVGFLDYAVGDPYMKGADRLVAAQVWLASQEPDLVGLQELNGYTPERLAKEAEVWGHDHVVLLKESGYDIALTAKSPITVVERLVTGMHHGMLHCRVDGIDVIVTHIYPGGDYKRKVREASLIIERVRKIKAEGRECIVMGDLNACTRQDEPLFGAAARDWHIKWKWNLVDDYPDYSTLDTFLSEGLVDTWVKHRSERTEQFPGRPRIDFILASRGLAKLSSGAGWVESDYMHTISDHPPVVADFEFSRRFVRQKK